MRRRVVLLKIAVWVDELSGYYCVRPGSGSRRADLIGQMGHTVRKATRGYGFITHITEQNSESEKENKNSF